MRRMDRMDRMVSSSLDKAIVDFMAVQSPTLRLSTGGQGVTW